MVGRTSGQVVCPHYKMATREATTLTTAYITHVECLLHEMGSGHPEQPARLRAVEDELIASGLIDHLHPAEATLAERVHLERVHTARYIDELEELAPGA